MTWMSFQIISKFTTGCIVLMYSSCACLGVFPFLYPHVLVLLWNVCCIRSVSPTWKLMLMKPHQQLCHECQNMSEKLRRLSGATEYQLNQTATMIKGALSWNCPTVELIPRTKRLAACHQRNRSFPTHQKVSLRDGGGPMLESQNISFWRVGIETQKPTFLTNSTKIIIFTF